MEYSADQIVDKTLIAAKEVAVKSEPFDAAPKVRTIAPGATVGMVYSWLEPRPGRSGLYWQFKDGNGFYYVRHKAGLFDEQFLKDQFTQEEIEKANSWQNSGNWWNPPGLFPTNLSGQGLGINETLTRTTKLIISFGVVALLIYAIPKILK